MNVIRWGAVVGVALTTAVTVVAAPIAFAQGGREAVAMAEHGTAILTFNTADPGAATGMMSLTGIGGDHLIGIDYRPNGELYGVGGDGTIYRIDDRTAAVTAIGELSVKPAGGYFDIDFTPSGDQLRVISDTGQNVHQPFDADGPRGATVVDGKLSRNNVTAMAYDGTGRLIDIDTTNRQLVVQDPKSGALTDLGKPGAFPTMSSSSNGLDIAGNDAFAVVNLDHVHTLFSVSTADGTAKQIGAFQGHVIDLTLKR